MGDDAEKLFLQSFLESDIADVEEQVVSAQADADEAFQDLLPVEEAEIGSWPDSDQPADRLYSRSIENNSDTAHRQLYDFPAAAGNVTLDETDWGRKR